MKNTSPSSIAEKIIEFIADQSFAVNISDNTIQTPLLEGDAIDSLSIVQLMMFLGTEFGVEIDDEDFVEENFATVGSLTGLVESKLQKAA